MDDFASTIIKGKCICILKNSYRNGDEFKSFQIYHYQYNIGRFDQKLYYIFNDKNDYTTIITKSTFDRYYMDLEIYRELKLNKILNE